MKKGFTLVELLVVIVIIWIILGAFAFLMVWYQKKVAFKTDIMKFKDQFFIWDKVYSTPQKKRESRGVFLIKEGQSFDVGYEDSTQTNMQVHFLKVAKIKDIFFDGERLSQLKLIKYPYRIDCPMRDNDGNLKKWEVTLKFTWVGKGYCGVLNLNICKITILKCVD